MARDTEFDSHRNARNGVRPGILPLLAGLWLAATLPLIAQDNGGVAKAAAGIVESKEKTSAPAPSAPDESPATDKATEAESTIKLLGEGGLENFYTWLEGAGVFVDTRGVFSINEGILRISGERTGYLATRREYSDYRLVAEYKWGEGKFGDRSTKPRNSGLLVHGVGEDRQWMRGIECQIAEGSSGSLVVHNGARFNVGTNSYSRSWTEVAKPAQDLEQKFGEWNTLEVISVGARLQVRVNGKLSVEASQVLPNRGKILLQSNGAEIFFRKLELSPLEKMPEEEPVKTASIPAAGTGK